MPISRKLLNNAIKSNRELLKAAESGTKELVPHFPRPVQDNIRDGYFYRYFGKIVNQSNIVEISETDYKKLKNNPRFIFAKVKWKIVGPIESQSLKSGAISYGVKELNQRAVDKADLTITGVRSYIRNYTQFWVGEDITGL